MAQRGADIEPARHADRLTAFAGSLLLHGVAVAAIVALAEGAAKDAPAPAMISLALEWVAAPEDGAANAASPGTATAQSSAEPREAGQPTREPEVDASRIATPTEPLSEPVSQATAEPGSEAPRDALPAPQQASVASQVAVVTPRPAPPRGDTSAEAPATVVAPSTPAPSSESAARADSVAAETSATPATGGKGAVWSVASRVPPSYPMSARRRGVEGEVVLRVDVAADGRPLTVSVKRASGERQLDEAAIRAVERWRFAVAVPMTVEIPIVFRLDDSIAAMPRP